MRFGSYAWLGWHRQWGHHNHPDRRWPRGRRHGGPPTAAPAGRARVPSLHSRSVRPCTRGASHRNPIKVGVPAATPTILATSRAGSTPRGRGWGETRGPWVGRRCPSGRRRGRWPPRPEWPAAGLVVGFTGSWEQQQFIFSLCVRTCLHHCVRNCFCDCVHCLFAACAILLTTVLTGTIMSSTIITIISKFLCHHVATILTISHLAAVLLFQLTNLPSKKKKLTNPLPSFVACFDK